MITFDDIINLRPEFKFGGEGMRMIEWFEVTRGDGYCCIRSGLRHADGVTKSPFHYEDCVGGDNADERALLRFNQWWEQINSNYNGGLNEDNNSYFKEVS